MLKLYAYFEYNNILIYKTKCNKEKEMRNNLTIAAFAALLMVGVASASKAATIAMDFTGSDGFANYVFDLQPGFENSLSLLSANINGAVYDSSSYTLEVYGFEVTDLRVLDSTGQVVSQLTFDGYFDTQNGTLDMFYYGDQTLYSGTSYTFNSASYPLLYDQNSAFSMTSVTVSPVPVPAAVWLFGSGLVGLAGIARRKA